MPASFGSFPIDMGTLTHLRKLSSERDGKSGGWVRNYQNPVQAELLQKVAKSRLIKGDTLEEIASDNIFENVLEVCDSERSFYPAYTSGEEIRTDEYRSLRKCRYLRLSEMNVQSLKQATIENLVQTC